MKVANVIGFKVIPDKRKKISDFFPWTTSMYSEP